MKKFFENRTVGFYVALSSALFGLIAAFTYMGYSLSVMSFDFLLFAMLFIGAASCIAVIFFDFPVLTVVSALLYGAALGYYIYEMAGLLAMFFTNTFIVSGSIEVMETVIVIMVMESVSMFVALVASFMKMKKSNAERANTRIESESIGAT